jgi:outer membrane receptor protein involved in Fe transport
MKGWTRVSVTAALPWLLFAPAAFGQATPPPAPATPATVSTSATSGTNTSEDLDEIVVNGIRRGDLILPTTVTSTSAFGLDLGVMDTPRNNTVLSKAQLDALNIQNPGGFSFLTSSSYSDASFGQPNVPRIRGQYGDMFFNGMRDSFTLNGYGAPISFNSVDSIDIVKGPASVQAGPGSGVGGAIDITTKMPSFTKFSGTANLEFDTQQKRRASLDLDGPLSENTAARVSFTSDDSGSYYYDMYFHQQSLFASVLTRFTPQYSVLFTAGLEDTRYRENDGVNRVNQALIDNGTYLTGGPVGGQAAISGYGTEVLLDGSTQLNDRVIIDEPAGTGAHSVHVKGQVIQTYLASDAFTIVNNSFYDFINRYNQTEDYYADTAINSYTFENKTDFKVNFATGFVNHSVDAGFTYRYAHVLDIQNYANEPVSVFDLSASPDTWVFPASAQASCGCGAVLYSAAFGHVQYGVPGRASGYLNASINSNLKDGAIFLEHRLKFSPEWSVLYGLRGDLVQLNDSDPLGGSAPLNGIPQSQSTNWYGLYNGNVSVVYSPTAHISAYLTYNNAQYVLADANDGAVGTLGVDPTTQLRQDTLLKELGLKFDLLDKALFISTAVFKQNRAVPTGDGGLQHSLARITGAEIELNYQPNPHLFATASYSFLQTYLDTPSSFWNFPAYPGVNYDGSGLDATYTPGQKFRDPGVPRHLFNVLANYKTDFGFGVQGNIQVTGKVETTQSGWLNVAATSTQYLPIPAALLATLNANGGYYQSPTIPTQYTFNVAGFYTYDKYTVKLSVYNLTDRKNVVNDYPFYGNDFLTRLPPRSYDVSFTGKF